jgi:O-antigen/teichoic acid export membrane protein
MSARRFPLRRLGPLGLNTIYTSIGLCLRAAMQAFYLVLLSRWMGPHGYGLFAGSVAASVLLAPLAGWGIQFLLMERVGRNRDSAGAMWATALAQTVASGGLLSGFVICGALAMDERVALGAMLLLAVSELVLVPITQAASALLLAAGRGIGGSGVVCLAPAFRLLGVILLLGAGVEVTPSSVAVMHFAGAVLGAMAAILVVKRQTGPARWHERFALGKTSRLGTRYAIGALMATSYAEVDKLLMLQLVGATAAGLYTTAFRVIAVLAIPVAALINNALPRLFAAHGTDWRRVFVAVAGVAAAYAVAAAVLALGAGPLMPVVFGAAFAEASGYTRMLAPWLVLYALHQVTAAGLTSLGRQGLRVAIESGGMAAVILLDLLLLPLLGGKGAALALGIAEAALAAGCGIALLRNAPQSRPQTK